jgi:Zn-finger nucleic acid-binding protein
MTRRIVLESESSDGEVFHEKLTIPYNSQDINNTDTSKQLKEQRESINHLQEERVGHLTKISEQNNEVMLLNSQLDQIPKQVRMMTTETDVLDKMLEGQTTGKPNGLGFCHEHLKQEHQNSSYAQALEYYHKDKKRKPVRKIKFVGSARTSDTTVKEQMLQYPTEPSNFEKVSASWKCHYCNKKGHIKPFCYKLYGYPRINHPKLHEPVDIRVKKVWRPKCVGLIAHTFLRVS